MSFGATKREWSKLYSFFRLLGDGKIYAGSAEMQKDETKCLPIAMIQREEHDGTRLYIVKNESVEIKGEKINKIISQSKFTEIALTIFQALKNTSDNDVESPDGVEEFLDEIQIYDLQAKTEDRTDYYIAFYSIDAPLIGMSVFSRIGGVLSLLDGGRTANLKFELTGIKFATPTINKINAIESPNEVIDRMLMIERLGGALKYVDVADKVFRCNLQMIDLHFPRLMAEMLRIMYLDGITKISDLTEKIKEINPLKIKDELINKHHFYEYKVKQLLISLALGMRSAKIYNGTESFVSGFIMVNSDGGLLCYQKSDRNVFENFLYQNTRLEKSSTEKDKYGYLERENGVYYFKLNLKISLLKR